MIYLDTSVALAALFAEPVRPPAWIWSEPLIASRLLEVELMVRVNARALGTAGQSAASALVDGVALVSLDAPILARALKPFPVAVRTLDALHLSTMDFLRAQGLELELASYDKRLAAAAVALGFPLTDI